MAKLCAKYYNFKQNIEHNRLEKRIARKKNRREKRQNRLIPIHSTVMDIASNLVIYVYA